jgi:hypothetical protein
MASTRGVRMEIETIEQLQRLSRALGRPQAEVLRRAVTNAYQATLRHAKYGPILQLIEQANDDGDHEA